MSCSGDHCMLCTWMDMEETHTGRSHVGKHYKNSNVSMILSKLVATYCKCVFAHLMGSMESSGLNEKCNWIANAELPLIAPLVCHLYRLLCLWLGEAMKGWQTDWNYWEIFLFFSISDEQFEADGIRELYKACSVSLAVFLPCDNRELWISGGNFHLADSLRTKCFQAHFEKLVKLLNICLHLNIHFYWLLTRKKHTL